MGWRTPQEQKNILPCITEMSTTLKRTFQSESSRVLKSELNLMSVGQLYLKPSIHFRHRADWRLYSLHLMSQCGTFYLSAHFDFSPHGKSFS